MALENLVGRGLLREPSDADELRRYLAKIAIRLADANNESISLGSRFDLAYEALLQIALTALRAHGYRPDSRGGHHQTVLQALPQTIDCPTDKLRLLDQFRRQRAQGIYDGTFEPSMAELDALLVTATELESLLKQWLARNRPFLQVPR